METSTSNAQPIPSSPNHSLPIKATIKDAWKCVHGFKGPYWLAFIIIMLISGGSQLLIDLSMNYMSAFASHRVAGVALVLISVLSISVNLISLLLSMGLVYMGLRRVANLTISSSMVFKGFSSLFIFKLLGLEIIKILIIIVFLAIPLIINLTIITALHSPYMILIDVIFFMAAYILFIRLSLAEVAIFDKNIGPIDALVLSFRATKGYVWRIFWIGFLAFLILLVSIIPIGIGLIWTLPLLTLIYPVVYKKLVGISIK